MKSSGAKNLLAEGVTGVAFCGCALLDPLKCFGSYDSV